MTKGGRQTVFVLHTSFSLVNVLDKLFSEELPYVRIVNVVDDSLLPDVRAAGRLTPSVTRRLVSYAMQAQFAGADAIFNTCSSVGKAADVMRKLVDIPVVKIDERMAEEAVSYGKRVAVVATLPTTLDPTVRLVERKAQEAGRQLDVRRHLAEGAFDVLMAGRLEEHDEMVSTEIVRAAQQADVVVLAQASMARLVPNLEEKLPIPLLSSPADGIKELKRTLEASKE